MFIGEMGAGAVGAVRGAGMAIAARDGVPGGGRQASRLPAPGECPTPCIVHFNPEHLVHVFTAGCASDAQYCPPYLCPSLCIVHLFADTRTRVCPAPCPARLLRVRHRVTSTLPFETATFGTKKLPNLTSSSILDLF